MTETPFMRQRRLIEAYDEVGQETDYLIRELSAATGRQVSTDEKIFDILAEIEAKAKSERIIVEP